MMVKLQLIGLFTIIRREVHRIFRIWPQTLLPSVITTTLYFLIFGNFIGNRIGTVDGVPYINFIIPGLIMMAIISNSYGNIVSSFYGAKFQRNIDEMLVSPMSSHVILLGFVIGGMIRGILVGTLVIIVALSFSTIHLLNLPLIIICMIFTSALFSLAGLINAVFAKSFDDISIIPTFVLTPLTYLGGVFYSISLLPEFWQSVSLFNPILYLVNVFRYGFLGVSDINVHVAMVCLLIMVVIMWIVCSTLISRGIGLKN